VSGDAPVIGVLNPTDDKGVIIAYLRMDDDLTLRFMWLPDIFREVNGARLDDETRAEIVDLLRFHASKLESKEMDARFTQLAEINIKRSQA